jgi:hypothetical protein
MEELGSVLESILTWAKIAGICGLICVGLIVFGRWGNSTPAEANETQRDDAGPELEQTKSTAPLQAPEPAESSGQAPPQAQNALPAIAKPSPDQPAFAQPEPVVPVDPLTPVSPPEPGCEAPLVNEVPAHKKHHGLRRFFGAIGHGFKVFGKGLIGR